MPILDVRYYGGRRGFATRSGVKLGTNDLVEPAANTPLPKGQFNINVFRARARSWW